MDSSIPKQIGRYSIDRLLGSGAMGYVFLGRDPELDRPVAIKTVRDLGMSPDALATFLERFRNEARAAARLHHPNIVQVYDVGEDPTSGPFLVFEYVAGATLKQTLRAQGPFEPEVVCRIADELGAAIAMAHQNGIIHRDIKPDNVLLTPDGGAKLADFGIARIPNATLTREGQFLGTPCYAAPETLDRGNYGAHSDLFSFAAMFYELISGERAFPGTDAVAVAHKVLHDKPVPLRQAGRGQNIPAGVEAVVMRGLEKDPKARYPHVPAFSDALRDAYATAGLVREPSRSFVPGAQPGGGAFERSGTESEGGSTFAFAAVLVGTLVVGLALVFAFTGGDGDELSGMDASVTDGGGLDVGASPVLVVDPPASDGGGSALVGANEAPDSGAGALSTPDLGGGVAANSEPPDAGVAPPVGESLTPHEREEAAKDAVDDAREALAAGDVAAARAALTAAQQLDPGNSDIARLRAQLARLSAAGPQTPPPSPTP
ncbi:MAG: serine/threonine protein kinase [Myxococcales bacterium]|nr:serine/threonine protein kinase [Myxococcales bacterium]MCB9628544.1 serine/threonine protein kinase [Sandaracinaceae bacterium]